MANPGRQRALAAGRLVFGSDFESGNCWRVDYRRGCPGATLPEPSAYLGHRPFDVPAPYPLLGVDEKKKDKGRAAVAPVEGSDDASVPAPAEGAAPPGAAAPAEDVDIYEIWLAADAMDTPYEHTNRSWFHFSVAGGQIGERVILRIMNTNPHEKLFEMDMRPVWKILDAAPAAWQRVPDPVVHRTIASNGVIDIPFTFTTADTVAIAFTYPYTVAMLNAKLGEYEARIEGSSAIREKVFYRRKNVGATLDGQPLDRITITSQARNTGAGSAEPVDGRVPACLRTAVPLPTDINGAVKPPAAGRGGGEGVSAEDGAPLGSPIEPCVAEEFGDKPVILVSARVHPSETPASFILEGLLDTLILDTDEGGVGEALREEFVFEIVPMLNPDGVTRGHCRNDSMGKNLNRFYAAPTEAETPSIYYLREAFLRLRARNQLYVYIDLHSHHSKRGWFLYGNYVNDPEAQVETEFLAHILARCSPHFDLEGCSFAKEKMVSKGGKDGTKEGSARVSLYKASGLVRCYTLEVNYNTSHITSGGGKVPPKYTPELFREMGRDLGAGFLGLRHETPEGTAIRKTLAEMHKSAAAAKKEKVQRRSSLMKRLNPEFVKAQQQQGGVLVV